MARLPDGFDVCVCACMAVCVWTDSWMADVMAKSVCGS
jgi:hypothetical protein